MCTLTVLLLIFLLNFGIAVGNSALPYKNIITREFRAIDIAAENVVFFLYQNGSNTPIIINRQNATIELNQTASYKFIIHGWTNNGTLPWIKKMASFFHKIDKFNVIAVDWSKDAAKNYVHALAATKSVGDHIADFILNLKIPLNKLHLIGFSLGAHVCGSVGQKIGAGKIDRITGLDPAGPLFEVAVPNLNSWKLTKNDAKFVDVIHAEVFFAGVVGPCGTVDFYVNKGGPQPDCLNNDTFSCSHNMAHTYYSLTIENPRKYKGVKQTDCISSSCEKDIAYMGYWVSRNTTGSYAVTAAATGLDPHTDF